MTPKGLVLFLSAVCAALPETSWGQKASNWRGYKADEGLPDSACISVAFAPQGKVLARYLTPACVSQLDGYAVKTIQLPEGGNARVCGSPGGQLWAMVPEGLVELREGVWRQYRVPEIAAEFQGGRLRLIEPVPLSRLFPVRQGLVLVLLPDELLEFNCDDPDHPRTLRLRAAAQTQLGSFSSLTLGRDGGLWIAGAHGLAKLPAPIRNLKAGTEWREYPLPPSLQIQNLQEAHEDEAGTITAVAEFVKDQQRTIVHFAGQRWTLEPIGGRKIRQAWRTPDNTRWAFTGHSLLQWEEGISLPHENEEVLARQYFDVALEAGGAFWLATSDGLWRYAPLAWRSPPSVQRINSLVHCLTGDQAGRLWFIAGPGLHSLENGHHQEYAFPANSALSSMQVRALFLLPSGTFLLVGEAGRDTEEPGDQLFEFQTARAEFTPAPGAGPGRSLRVLGLLNDGSLCVQSHLQAPEQPHSLEEYDGARFQPFPEPPPDLVLKSRLERVFSAQNGDLWLSGDAGLAWYHDKKWRTFASADRTAPEAAVGFAELADGKIWCAAGGQIWEFDGRNWSIVRRGFERIPGLLRAGDGSIWVASNRGLYRFFKGAWVRNGVEEGLSGADVRQVYEDRQARVWAGTTHGLSLYHPEADPDPPRTSIQATPGAESRVPEGGTITLTFSGQDKWQYTPRDRLLYSYRLDEHDWSAFETVNGVSFTDLPPGKHYFQVRAMDRNCNLGPPDKTEFVVILPWYKETRLVLISLVGLAVALFFAGLAFNRHRQLLRSYAEVEKKVAERTLELQLANRELLHSQKMTALGTLAAGIAHDFNNILSIIKGSAQIIEDNLDNPPKVITRVDRIKTVVEQGAGIVKAMLGFSRDSDQQATLCDLNSVVEDTTKLLGDRFLREVQVSFEPAPDLPQVPASKDLVQQVLLNFIFNAAESMAERKRIILATRALDKLPAGLRLTPAQAGGYVSVSVGDFGCGIPPENMPRIFEPFFTTKALSARRGTGLGLSMVYELARKMGAGLAVESVVGQGSTFTLILAVRDAARDSNPNEHDHPHH